MTWENEEIAPEPLEVEPGAIRHIWCPSVIRPARSPVTSNWTQATATAPPRDDARLTKVTKVDPQTGNANQIYVPPGCDLSLPMIGDSK